MLNDITLGQYFPGNSCLHRRDPRIKILTAILYIVVVFLCQSLVSFAFLLLATLVLALLSRVPMKILLKSVKPLLVVLIFMTVYNLFFHSGKTILLDVWILQISLEGVIFAVMMAVRIICLLVGSSLILTYTTTPIRLTDGIERLLAPLKVLHLPVHEFAMMMTIALRFIPTLVEETDKIMCAQKARGTDFSRGNLIQRAKSLIPILIPLFFSAFRRAGDLAVAMECRCYRGGDGRTRMTKLRMTPGDLLLMAVMVAIGAIVLLLNPITLGLAL